MVDLSNELLALTDASPRIVIGSDNREKIIVPGIGSRFWVYDAHEPWDGYRMLNQGEFLKTTSVDSGLELGRGDDYSGKDLPPNTWLYYRVPQADTPFYFELAPRASVGGKKDVLSVYYYLDDHHGRLLAYTIFNLPTQIPDRKVAWGWR